MNKEEAIEYFKETRDEAHSLKLKQALTMAIESLEQKPSGEYEDAYDVLIGIAGKSRVDNNAVKTTECIKAMHEFHNQFPSVKQCGCMTHCNCPIFQPPVKAEGGKRPFEDILEDDYNVQLGDNRRDESIHLAAIKYAQQYQKPVISDEEIDIMALNYNSNRDQTFFIEGMKTMRKLLTNKD